MATLIFHGQFHDADGLGLTGLTVTCDVYRTALSDGTTSQVVTAGSASETGGGIYRYLLASADPSTYHYVANLKTTDTDAAQRHVAALGLVVPDAQVSAVPAGVLGAADVTPISAALAPVQGAVTFGQVKILANVSGEGALHVVNSHANGYGQCNQGGNAGQYNYGINNGQYNYGSYNGQYNYGLTEAGQRNQGGNAGQYNYGNNGQYNYGSYNGQYNYGSYNGQYNYGLTEAGQLNQGSLPIIGAAQQEIADALKLAPAAGTPATGSVYDLLGDVSIDPQAVRDAMLLAPTPPGTAAAGSVDAKLDAIQDKTDLLSGGTQVIVVSALAGSALTITRGDTLSASFVNVGSVSGYANIWFTVKRDRETADSAALVQIDTDTGLLYANGVAASAASGSITVDDAATGDLTIALAATVTATLPVGTGYYYDIQWMAAGGAIHTLASGVASVAADVTRSVA